MARVKVAGWDAFVLIMLPLGWKMLVEEALAFCHARLAATTTYTCFSCDVTR